MKNRITWMFIFLFLSFANCCFANDHSISLLKKIEKIAEASHCIIGVSAIHIESNKKISYHGDTPFFMASTVKLPIALTLLQRVDKKQEDLNRVIQFDQQNSVPGSGNLYLELSRHPESHKSDLKQLLRLMLVVSDNTASDLILQEVKGPKAVNFHLRQLGFNHISVNRSIYDLYLSSSGLTLYPNTIHKLKNLNQAVNKVHPQKKVTAWQRFEKDVRDTTTPNEMALLLMQLYEGKLISAANTNLLLNIMSECQTGKHRIKGLLPQNVRVAHKTGTWSLGKDKFLKYPASRKLFRYANDVGIITLPNKQGHVAIAIYVKSRAIDDRHREQTIALISRQIYNYFLQTAGY